MRPGAAGVSLSIVFWLCFWFCLFKYLCGLYIQVSQEENLCRFRIARHLTWQFRNSKILEREKETEREKQRDRERKKRDRSCISFYDIVSEAMRYHLLCTLWLQVINQAWLTFKRRQIRLCLLREECQRICGHVLKALHRDTQEKKNRNLKNVLKTYT